MLFTETQNVRHSMSGSFAVIYLIVIIFVFTDHTFHGSSSIMVWYDKLEILQFLKFASFGRFQDVFSFAAYVVCLAAEIFSFADNHCLPFIV